LQKIPTTNSTRIAVYRPSPTRSSRLTTIGKTEDPVQNITTFNWLPSTITSTLTSDDSWVFNDFTIVTALIDIGRGEWDRYRRPLEQYHFFMENLLSLQNNMVIFTDKASYDFIHKYRKNMGEMHRTKIHLVTLGDLPLSSHLDVASKLIEEEHRNEQLWRYNWDPAMKDHPESKSAEYDVLVNSKSYFLYNASLEDPFATEFFVWIDAGYGHGNQSVFPYNNKWKPRFPKNRISLIKVCTAILHFHSLFHLFILRDPSSQLLCGSQHLHSIHFSYIHRPHEQSQEDRHKSTDDWVRVIRARKFRNEISVA
uniref:FCP1 homology domain-containing protein n=1 Tax=Angiostrongylus costaricensis TaxID=334426 RepID=A0A158PMM9_ANGCS